MSDEWNVTLSKSDSEMIVLSLLRLIEKKEIIVDDGESVSWANLIGKKESDYLLKVLVKDKKIHLSMKEKEKDPPPPPPPPPIGLWLLFIAMIALIFIFQGNY